MRLYRWEHETMVPDNALNTQLGLGQWSLMLQDWLAEVYPLHPLRALETPSALVIMSHMNARDQTGFIAVAMANDTVLIWCEHWGDMLACYRWFVDLAAAEAHMARTSLTPVGNSADSFLSD